MWSLFGSSREALLHPKSLAHKAIECRCSLLKAMGNPTFFLPSSGRRYSAYLQKSYLAFSTLLLLRCTRPFTAREKPIFHFHLRSSIMKTLYNELIHDWPFVAVSKYWRLLSSELLYESVVLRSWGAYQSFLQALEKSWRDAQVDRRLSLSSRHMGYFTNDYTSLSLHADIDPAPLRHCSNLSILVVNETRSLIQLLLSCTNIRLLRCGAPIDWTVVPADAYKSAEALSLEGQYWRRPLTSANVTEFPSLHTVEIIPSIRHPRYAHLCDFALPSFYIVSFFRLTIRILIFS